jgi:hypothetical protein
MPEHTASIRPARVLKWLGLALAACVVGAIVFLALVDWNRFREPLARHVSEKSGYAVRIDGDLRVHLLSRTPSVSAAGVSVSNPRWRERARLLAFDNGRSAAAAAAGRPRDRRADHGGPAARRPLHGRPGARELAGGWP